MSELAVRPNRQDSESVGSNLYLPVKKISQHLYQVSKDSQQWLPLSRCLFAWSQTELVSTLAPYIPKNRLQQRGKKDLIEEYLRGERQNEQVLFRQLAEAGEYDSLVYWEEKEEEEEVVLTVQPDVPLFSLPPRKEKGINKYRVYPPIRLETTQPDTNITNLMILAARGWDQYLRQMGDLSQISLSLLDQAYPYTIGKPGFDPWFCSAEKNHLYYRQEAYLKEKNDPLTLLRSQPWNQVFLSIRPMENGTGELVVDAQGKKYAVTQVAGVGWPYRADPDFLQHYGTAQGWEINEYLDGTTLEGQSYSLSYLLYFAKWLCSTVQKLHQLGYAHGRIAPSNILRSRMGKFKLQNFQHLSTQFKDQLKDNQQVAETLTALLDPTSLPDKVGLLPYILRDLAQGKKTLTQVLNELRFIWIPYSLGAEYQWEDGQKILLHPEILTQEKFLGAGFFGEVYLVKDQAWKEYALKIEQTSEMGSKEDVILPLISAFPNCHSDYSCVIDTFYFWQKQQQLEDWEQLAGQKDEVLMRGILYEYIRGQTVGEAIDEGRNLPGLMAWLVRVLDDLQRQGIAHQDITENNVMQTTDRQFKLIDFGIAQKISEGGSTEKDLRLAIKLLKTIYFHLGYPNKPVKNALAKDNLTLAQLRALSKKYPKL